MLTCKEASQLVSEQHDRNLGRRERIALRIHLWMCRNCRRFERQLSFLRNTLRRGVQEGQLPLDKTLPPDSKARIREHLHKHDHTD
ncbi:MAG: zf-HC2 domain-containing protein [Gammaproteobacteria bacterium]|jgi:hypothetical protein